ncbi:MAG: ATP-binding cassette domain-containing protein [Chitinivibrionales bacterium]|nr:ATP-binding cassette domain-containing protein [Chitinivibrionales bacterium]
MNSNNAIIQTKNLCKSYYLGRQSVDVLFDISFSVDSGEYVAIMGHSGAGKSTLLNILGCLDIPGTGEYCFSGQNISSLSESRLADIRNGRIGFIFQNFNLLPKLDVYGNVELPLIYGNVSRRERVEKIETVLKKTGLWERRKHKPNEISGGQKQRVAIARALVKNPALILADEPTGNLDSQTTAEIMNVLDEIHGEGNTIVVITHENDVAARAKRIVRLVDGKIYQ